MNGGVVPLVKSRSTYMQRTFLLVLRTRFRRCLVAGFFANVAKLSPDGRYRTVRDSTVVAIHPSSVLAHFGSPPEWILFNEISKTSQLFARDVSVIDPRYSHVMSGAAFAS